MLTHGSLFSGIGGFDLAAQKVGWENVFHCEINPFGQRLLSYYWPNAKSYTDITKTNFSLHRGKIDVLSGGFPCQPYSQAGERKGAEDERHLWPEMLRAIREVQPKWVVGENVRGLINWNDGVVFEQVQTDLENEGYEVLPFLLPASGVGAPHERYRIWFVAYSHHFGGQGRWGDGNQQAQGAGKRESILCTSDRLGEEWLASYTNDQRIQGRPTSRYAQESGTFRQQLTRGHDQLSNWAEFPTQSPLCSGNDGLPSQLDGITFSKFREESLKGGGNAVVVPLVVQIFTAINSYHNQFA